MGETGHMGHALAIFKVQMPGTVRFAGDSAAACIPCKGGASRFPLWDTPTPRQIPFNIFQHVIFNHLLRSFKCSTAVVAVLEVPGCAI